MGARRQMLSLWMRNISAPEEAPQLVDAGALQDRGAAASLSIARSSPSSSGLRINCSAK